MKNASKGSKISGKPNGTELKKDRKSGTGLSGSPKKGGHGGKFTWAGDGYWRADLGSVEVDNDSVDVNDPNFEDIDEMTP